MNKSKQWYQRPWIVTGMVVILLLLILFVVPVPYYVMQPGSAMEVRPMVRVQGAQAEEKGAFLMTTIYMGKGNVLGVLLSQFDSRYELVPKKNVLIEGEDPEDYRKRQKKIMEISQQKAILAAFHETGHSAKERLLGVRVFRVLQKMPATNVLKSGDLIIRVDGKNVKTTEDLLTYLGKKNIADRVTLQVKRDGKVLTKRIKLGKLNGDRPGIGIEPMTERKVKTTPKVTIHADDVGGPSAGLMFTLEIINQLVEHDLTNGYRVAGTGTITPEGQVGQIGGIQHKIVAAEEENADIFFVPADIHPRDSNEKLAKKTVKEIGADMKLVPVKSLDEALSYLENEVDLNKAS
ncbi:SepM family pheromone-processing serine protease [Melghirimyces algeriensis]|uniref:endopeptidase La n=1 Tax=Melghirimyces algeriensis TaxID=910412 RepID=A0A521BHZ5_9BACL|nr:SepM family pheromone-processing serine protease [Melghirimyces algeriensis]SMO46531.1 PDZ domain-containing protein [Melghirimyces algeriensis]